MCVCVCVREREGESVCERERERERDSIHYMYNVPWKRVKRRFFDGVQPGYWDVWRQGWEDPVHHLS